jgi:hypothetical protein
LTARIKSSNDRIELDRMRTLYVPAITESTQERTLLTRFATSISSRILRSEKINIRRRINAPDIERRFGVKGTRKIIAAHTGRSV